MANTDKVTRMLALYSQILDGKKVNKSNFCLEYGINERTFERDIEDIRLFLSESYSVNELCYLRGDNAYQLTRIVSTKLSGEEAVVLASQLFSQKTFRTDEIEEMLENLIGITDRQDKENVYRIVRNKLEHNHWAGKSMASIKIQWDIERCILNRKVITLDYQKGNGECVQRKVKPVEIIYDDGYGYLAAYRCDKEYPYPAFFRLDRIHSFKVGMGEFDSGVLENYKELNIRNYLKYMQAGEILEVTLQCDQSKRNLVEESFCDTKLLQEKEGKCIILVKSFQQGFLQWLLGQGDTVEVLEPAGIREEIWQIADTVRKLYEEKRKEDGETD